LAKRRVRKEARSFLGSLACQFLDHFIYVYSGTGEYVAKKARGGSFGADYKNSLILSFFPLTLFLIITRIAPQCKLFPAFFKKAVYGRATGGFSHGKRPLPTQIEG
jgi:hypothetical protein